MIGPAMFDPWTATIEEAMAAQAAHDQDTSPVPSYAQPIFQWQAAYDIEKSRPRCERGDGYSVMHAMHLCTWHRLVAPDWLAREFMRRFRMVSHAKVGSWDEAFRRPYPKGVHLRRMLHRRNVRHAIYNDVRAAVRTGRAIDESLFEEVGKAHNTGKTLAEKLYREALAMLHLPPAAEALLRQLMARLPTPANSGKLAGVKKKR